MSQPSRDPHLSMSGKRPTTKAVQRKQKQLTPAWRRISFGNRLRLPVIVLMCIAGLAGMAFLKAEKNQTVASAPSTESDQNQPRTLKELLQLPVGSLEKLDIALINLLATESLRGAESLDVQKALKTLDEWARIVDRETKRQYHQFMKHPAQFKHSLGYFRMMVLGSVLAEDLGMRYNPEIALPIKDGKKPLLGSSHNSKDLFIHGLLSGDRYGTCASMPVLMVAIARRLGYPVNLAATKLHRYVRYEEENGKHFNIEPTNTDGFLTPSDQDYIDGKFKSTEEEIQGYGWLRPLSNAEALGGFLDSRATVLGNMKRYKEGKEMLVASARYLPDTPVMREALERQMEVFELAPAGDTWDVIREELKNSVIPQGPRYAYFYNRRLQMYYFMSGNTNALTIEKAAEDFKVELAGYQQQTALHRDGPPAVSMNERQPVLQLTIASGKEVFIPAATLPPPLNRGVLPQEYLTRVGRLGIDHQGLVLDEIWTHYKETNPGWMNETDDLLPEEPQLQNRSQSITVSKQNQ